MSVYKSFLKFLKDKFEPVSLAYHIFFLSFLIWCLYIKPPDQKVNTPFLRVLGIYVICYGLVILIYSPGIINKTPQFKNL